MLSHILFVLYLQNIVKRLNMRSLFAVVTKALAVMILVSMVLDKPLVAQTIGGLSIYPESVETLQDNPVSFLNDPITNGNSINIPGSAETENNFTLPEGNVQFGMSAEMGFSPLSKYLSIPLSIGYKGFTFGVSIPFYIQKKAKYSEGLITAWGGLGDIDASLSYRLQKPKIFESFTVTSTFPTGNQNRTVKGYIVPMGTGSFDFIFSNTFQYKHTYFRIYNNLSYRLSGKCKRDINYSIPYYDSNMDLRSGTETVNFITSNGNLFSCNTSFDYPLFNFMSLHAGFAILNSSSGTIYQKHTYSWNDESCEIPSQKSNQSYTSIDVRAAIAFSYWGIDLMCVIAQPVYVKTDNPNIKDSQKFNFYIRLSKKIF